MRKWIAIMAIFLVGLCSTPRDVVSAELDSQRLLKIQVAYVLNFAKFISWPASKGESPQPSFVIGVYGVNPFADLLDGLDKKTVQGQMVETRVLTDLSQTENCQILFVGDLDGQQELFTLLDFLQGKPVVTVSTLPSFAKLGGIIELQQQGEYVVFSVNLGAAEKSGVTIPAQVLALAVDVIRATR